MKLISKTVRFEVFKRDGFACRYCGRSGRGIRLQIDHVKPRVRGGSNDQGNLVTACSTCNSGKGRVGLDEKAEPLERFVVYVYENEHRQMRKIIRGRQSFSQWVRGHMQQALSGLSAGGEA